MTSQQRTQLRTKIEKAIEEVEDKVERREESAAPVSPENAIGRVSRMGAINSRGVAEAALNQAKRKLVSLRTALHKIDEPEFGQCTLCGGEIQEGRLMYMPESAYCMNCAK